MNLDHTSTYYTLDWDDITLQECKDRLRFIAQHPQTHSVQYRQSANSGYHVKVGLRKRMAVLPLRRKYRDDGRRIINDILNRPTHIHDILWDTKLIATQAFTAGKWEQFK